MTSGITGASSSSSITNPNTATGASQEIAGNFQQFLTLLTTQLKNQNPMDPLDTNQFHAAARAICRRRATAEVERPVGLDPQQCGRRPSAAAATGFIGQSVTADGRVANLKDGSAVWTLTPARAAKQATMTISDAKGTWWRHSRRR